MERTYYRDQVLETIARKVLCAYDTTGLIFSVRFLKASSGRRIIWIKMV